MNKFFLPFAIVVCALPAHAQNPVSVSVFDEAGKPIAGALVSVRVFAPDEIKIAPQNTDAKGKTIFSMPNDKNGKPTIGAFLAGAKGYSFGSVIGGTMGVLEGEKFSTIPLEIRLAHGQTWRGKVVDDKGKPLEGAQISVRGARKGRDYDSMLLLSDEKLGALYSAKSKADGTFEIPDLPADRDLFYAVTRPMFARFQGQDASVDVTELIKMTPGGVIKGRALDVAGKPLTKLKIYASSANYDGGGEGTTDANGDFTIDGLAPGIYDLVAVVPDDAAFVMSRLKGVRVAASKTATASEWRAVKGAEIRGIVTDSATKKPIVGASFAAQNKDDVAKNNDSAWATSDKNGAFVLRVLPGQYKVRSSGGSTDYLRSQVTQNIEAKNGVPAQVKFELQKAPVVRGITRDESGKPVAAKLLVGSFGGFGPNVISDAQGKWQYTPHDTDDIGIGGGEDDKGYFEIISPKRVDWPVKGPIVVTVRRHAWQKLAGRVVTPDGAPIEGAKVEASFGVQVSDSTSYGATVSASSDKDGRYVLERLRDSRRRDVMGTEVEVSAKKDGYQFQSGGKVTRVGNEPRVSDLVFAPLSAQIAGTTEAGADVVVAGRQTRADETGRFSFDALPAGKNIVYAAKGDRFGSAPISQNPLEIKLTKLQPQGRDEALAHEIWDKAMAGKTDGGVADLDEWSKGDDFVARLRKAQRSGESYQIGYALGRWEKTDSPESLALARETLAEMPPSEARTGAYLQIAVNSGDADLTERALELAQAQFDAKATDTRTREYQLYLAAVLIERRDGAEAGALALRAALAYTLQTHPENSRVEGAMQTEVGRNEALADAAPWVAPGSPALLGELIETIDAGSGFAIRARANAVPVVERARGFEAAAPLLEELRTMPEPTLDLKIRYQDFTPAWAYGQAVSNVIPLIGPTDAGEALKLARSVEGDDEQRGRALARAARYQSLAVAAPLLREAVEKISSEDAPRVAAMAYERDQKLGLELFEVARQKADDDMKSVQYNWRNTWISFAFGYARANSAGARLILEREWAKSRAAKADADVLASIAIAMAPIDGQRAAEMARESSGSWSFDAQVKIARYLIADDETRRGFVLDRIGSRDGWDAGELQW